MVTLASRSSGTLHFFSFFPCEVMRVVPRMCKLQKRGGEILLMTQSIFSQICFCCVSMWKSKFCFLKKGYQVKWSFLSQFSRKGVKNYVILPQTFKVRDWNMALLRWYFPTLWVVHFMELQTLRCFRARNIVTLWGWRGRCKVHR